jgi:hypothetical protein
LAFARVLESVGTEDWAAREDFAANAESAWTEAGKWMTLLQDVTPQERSRLEFKLAQLRAALDHTRRTENRVCAAS